MDRLTKPRAAWWITKGVQRLATCLLWTSFFTMFVFVITERTTEAAFGLFLLGWFPAFFSFSFLVLAPAPVEAFSRKAGA